MDTVYSLNDAMNWFLNNSDGCVICSKENGRESIVDNYKDAKEFFEIDNAI